MFKKKFTSIIVMLAIVFCVSFTACTTATEPDPVTLDVPSVAISTEGAAQWNKVDNAVGYKYIIDEGFAVNTTALSVQLNEGQSIKVKAVGDGENCLDSAYSEVKTYTKSTITPCRNHTDADDNGICDVCNANVLNSLSIISLNDLHGKFKDTDTQPGVDEFSTYIKSLYADESNYEILLSAGDMWQGTVESSLNKGALMTSWMNDTGFVSMTLGNHEFDWGTEYIARNSQLANFPFLAINVRYNGLKADFCQPSVVVEKGGIKVGIIGAIGDCLSSISGEFQDGLSFVTGTQLTNLIKAESKRLRNEEGCDIVVLSQHEGYESSSSTQQTLDQSDIPYYDVSLSNGYIDLVFEAHTHQNYIFQDKYGILHIQGGGENKYISKAEISFNSVTSSYSTSAQLIRSYSIAGMYQSDESLDDIYSEYFPDSDPYTDVLGNVSSYKNSDSIVEKVAELYLQTGLKTWGDKYDIVLGGGYLKTRSPYNLSAGNVTYADIFSLLPFDNSIVLGSISGRDLLNKFINTNNSNYHCAYNGVTPTNISNNKTYYIIVDTYTSSYAPNKITEVARLNSNTYSRDLLAQYIREGNWS